MSEVMTVGELRQVLADLPDDVPVTGWAREPRVDAYLHEGTLHLESF